MTESSLQERRVPNLGDFLKNISPDNPTGPSLRYDPIYDDIRLARKEDDPRLSMGIWKTDLKHAQWGTVEALCTKALITQSKDLQIAAWLIESWISLDDIKGYTRGIQLISNLIDTFWDAIHPQPQEDDDIEARLMILEWIDRAFSARLLHAPLTQSQLDQTTFGVGFFKSAQHSDANQKRAEKTTKNVSLNQDPSKIIGTVEEFQRSLDYTTETHLTQQQKHIEDALQETQGFKVKLSTLLGSSSPSFSQILGTLKEMERIVKTALQSRKPSSEEETPEPSNLDAPPQEKTPISPNPPQQRTPPTHLPQEEMISGQQPIQNREEAYEQLETIAAFLEKNDPHSLAPQLLHQLIRWKDKNVINIFEDIAKTPEEYNILMKILGAPTSPK